MNGIERQFYDYHARGAPYGPDDGTVAPWVVVASLPFAPEVVIPTVREMAKLDLGEGATAGLLNPKLGLRMPNDPTGYWVTPYHFGIDQGPVILMIENYRTVLIWVVADGRLVVCWPDCAGRDFVEAGSAARDARNSGLAG